MTAVVAYGRFAAECPVGRRYQSIASGAAYHIQICYAADCSAQQQQCHAVAATLF